MLNRRLNRVSTSRRPHTAAVSALFALGCAAAPAICRSAPEAPIVFANFEDGSYDGWSTEGNCWGREPATDLSFGGQIVGYNGHRYACTLDARMGCQATGSASSREFTIAKPFIYFLIGGGNYPRQACFNLVVDGAVVETATGTDLPSFEAREWNVQKLIGKTAHFEIVDSTRAAHRGYIMVDDVEFRDTSLAAPPPSPPVPFATQPDRQMTYRSVIIHRSPAIPKPVGPYSPQYVRPYGSKKAIRIPSVPVLPGLGR